MKLHILYSSLIMAVCICLQSVIAYEPPTDDELEALLANPELLEQVLADATGAEAAALMLRINDRVQSDPGMNQPQKNSVIASLAARIVAFMPSDQEKNSFTNTVMASAGANEAVILAGIAIGGESSPSFIAGLQTTYGENPVLSNAVSNPEQTLTTQVYNVVRAIIGTEGVDIADPGPSPVDQDQPGDADLGEPGPATDGVGITAPPPPPPPPPLPPPAPAPPPPVALTYDGQG